MTIRIASSLQVFLTFSLLVTLISGCATQPTIYVYGKYLDQQQTLELKTELEKNNFSVEVNDFVFPTSITDNTILYSLLLSDTETLTVVENLITKLHIPIANIQGLTEGNHWYTKNSLALFILPEDTSGSSAVFKQDLSHDYELDVTQGCELTGTLALREDGSYSFNLDQSSAKMTKYLSGRWLYRQYPYLELRPEKEPHSSGYFEISKVYEQDQISKIDFTQLTAIESKVVTPGCILKYGMRY